MRKIEQQMIQAIRNGTDWGSGNTEVRHDPVIGGTEAEVYLHGHLIAKCIGGGWHIDLCGWNTLTTRSRLTALLQAFVGSYVRGVSTKQGQAFIRYESHIRNIPNNGMTAV